MKKGASHPSQPGAMHRFPSQSPSVCDSLSAQPISHQCVKPEPGPSHSLYCRVYILEEIKCRFSWMVKQPRQRPTDLAAHLMRTNGVLPPAGKLFLSKGLVHTSRALFNWNGLTLKRCCCFGVNIPFHFAFLQASA